MNLYKQYNKPLSFKGDIVITDPCYLMRKEGTDICLGLFPKVDYPDEDSFYKYGRDQSKYPDFKKGFKTFKWKLEFFNELCELFDKGLCTVDDMIDLFSGKKTELVVETACSEMYQKANHEYHKALEEYYDIPHRDWDYCESGKNMSVLGITQSIVSDTLYGDWSCTTFEIEDEKASVSPEKVSPDPLGQFCADAGLVGVFLVEEIMNYNPDAITFLKDKPWCATFINNFDGNIFVAKTTAHFVDEEDDEDYYEEEVRLVGDGNIKFITSQTGL